MLTIQQLSHEVNIGVDTLRVWERRYGFPSPVRDSRGHRRYPTSQLEELRIVRRLQAIGYRPSKIFKLNRRERLNVLDQCHEVTSPELKHYQELIKQGAVGDVESHLRLYLERHDLKTSIFQRVVPIVQILDRLWSDGSLSIAREHLVSDMLTELLKEQLLLPDREKPRGRIVFLTLCGERHKLGLLMSAVLFRCAGAHCLVIQEELPLTEVPQLALDTGSNAVALSFSSHYSTRQAKRDLALLRGNLDPDIVLIAGGEAASGSFHLPGLILCPDLRQIPAILDKIERKGA